MKIQPYQKLFLKAYDHGQKITLFYPRIRRAFVTYPEAQAMLKTGKWITPAAEKDR